MMEDSKGNLLRFTWMEFSGSLGDLGLFLPLVVAMTIAADLDLGVIFIFAGLMNIVTGLLFRQPLPVQPMKTIAVIVITEGLSKGEMVAAGVVIGVILVLCAGLVEVLNRFIPKTVVRGIQLGVGLKLAVKGVGWMSGLPLVGWDSLGVAAVVTAGLIVSARRKWSALAVIFAGGFLLLYGERADLFTLTSLSGSVVSFHWPSAVDWGPGVVKGALPQLALTLLNSVVAVCALSGAYFPGRGVSARKVALSVGLMNLVCVPLGGIPMCHGAGGLAAQYRFGARTGGSVVMLGVLKIFVGVMFGGALLVLLENYPLAVLGPMLVFAGVELAKSARDVLSQREGGWIVLMTAAFILGVNTWVGFLVGCGIAGVDALCARKDHDGKETD